jgi:PAS domain S-box-containing protein
MAWSCTSDGRLEYFNRNLVEYVGLPFDEIVGFGFYRMFHPDDVEPMRMAWDDIVASKKSRPVDARIRRADGEYRWFNLRQSPLLDSDGNVVRWYGVVVDIEDRKRAEESLRQSQSDLAHVTRMTATGELAVSIAHEVNQPLMAIVTNAGTCLRWLQPGHTDLEQARLAAERIVKDGHRAGDIITSIRAMAQKLPARIEQTDFKPAVREVLDLLRGELQRREIEVVLDMSDAPVEIIGDRTQIQQVVLNLVMNSAEAMAASSRARRINIRCSAEEQLVSVSVSDTGHGISIDELDRVFEAFYSTKADGIGMGLSICRSIVEAHGGRIWASAAENGIGGLFTFTLPMSEGIGVHDR